MENILYKDVIIDIKGTQNVNGAEDTVELTTVGKMNIKDGKTYLRYDDSSSSGEDGVSCLIKIDDSENSVVMQRSGRLNSGIFAITTQVKVRSQWAFSEKTSGQALMKTAAVFL